MSKGNVKKQYMAIRRKPNAPDEYDVGGKKLKLGSSGGMLIHDHALARDLDQKFGRFSRNVKGGGQSLMVVEIDDRKAQWVDGYKCHFAVPDLPWKKDDAPKKKSKRARRR